MLPPKGSNLGEAKLQSLRGEAFVKLNKACPDQTGDIYAEWLERISVIAEEAFWTGDASRRLRIIGVLGACWKMVHETQKHEDRERVGAYMLVDSYLVKSSAFALKRPKPLLTFRSQLRLAKPGRIQAPVSGSLFDAAQHSWARFATSSIATETPNFSGR